MLRGAVQMAREKIKHGRSYTPEEGLKKLFPGQTIDDALAEAAEEYKTGAPLVEAKSALKTLREKHGSKPEKGK